jgi:hypothetical protein
MPVFLPPRNKNMLACGFMPFQHKEKGITLVFRSEQGRHGRFFLAAALVFTGLRA